MFLTNIFLFMSLYEDIFLYSIVMEQYTLISIIRGKAVRNMHGLEMQV